MKPFLSRMAWMFTLLALGASCGGESSLWIKLTEWPAGAENLNVVAWINGIRQDEFSIPKDRPGFVVALPEGASGEIHLQLTAMDGDRCKVGTAEVADTLNPGLRHTREREVQVQPLEVPLCTLRLELPANVAVTSSTPPGLSCPMGSARCEAELPKGGTIEVELQLDSHAYSSVSAFEASCDEEGRCAIGLEKTKSTRVELARRNCKFGFCLYRSAQEVNALSAVWGLTENQAWAVSAGGKILKWNGKAWSVNGSGTQPLSGVWGLDENQIWAVGDGGSILFWDGTRWKPVPSGTTENLYGVWGSDAKNVWVVGAGGTIRKWNGFTWTTQNCGATENLYGVWGSDANNIWVVGRLGTTRKWNGNAWTDYDDHNNQSLYAVSGSDVKNVWSVARYGYIFRWENDEWQNHNDNPTGWEQHTHNGVWTSDANNVWAVGKGGVIRTWDGAKWITKDSGFDKEEFLAVWGSSKDDVWVVGSTGTILRWKQ